MNDKTRDWLIAGGVAAIAVIVLWGLWQSNAGTGSSAPATVGTTQLGSPAPIINLTFQTVPSGVPPISGGYVPLFGFLGYYT